MSDQSLTLSTETGDGTSIIHVIGELDMSTVAVFEAELDQSLSADRVVIVLSECTFIDSSALRALVRAERAARDGGGRLALVAPSRSALRVIEVASLESVLPVFESVADAVTSSA